MATTIGNERRLWMELEYRTWYLLESPDATRQEVVEELEGIKLALQQLKGLYVIGRGDDA